MWAAVSIAMVSDSTVSLGMSSGRFSAISAAASPINKTCLQQTLTAVLSAWKDWPLACPPAMRIMLPPLASPPSADTVAPTFVALLSLTYETPPTSAIDSQRCGRPRRDPTPVISSENSRPTPREMASAASTFRTLCAPVTGRSVQGTNGSKPKAIQGSPSTSRIPNCCKSGSSSRHAIHGTSPFPTGSVNGSLALTATCLAPAKMRCLAR